MNIEELKLLGLSESPTPALDTDAKVEQFAEQQTKAAEEHRRKWNAIDRAAAEEAKRHQLP